MMKNLRMVAVSLIMALFAGPAFAHTDIIASNIPDGSELTQAPSVFEFTFGAEVGLAGLNLETLEGQSVEIGFQRPKEMGKDFAVALPALRSGGYILKWRAVAKDGHVMKGEVDFTITG